MGEGVGPPRRVGSKGHWVCPGFSSSQDHDEDVGQRGLDLGPGQVSPMEPGARHFHALVSSPPCLPQQLSPAPLPAELLAPLTYISLVGCSVSIVASLISLLLHFHAR